MKLSVLIPYVLSVGLGFALGWLPLLSGPSYETALIAGLFLPSACAYLAARRTLQTLPGAAFYWLDSFAVLRRFCRGLFEGGLIWASFLLGNLIHALRLGWCEPLGDLKWMFYGPGLGCLMGAAWGGVLGLLLFRYRAAFEAQRGARFTLFLLGMALGSIALPIASAGVSLWRFYSSPMVFAYDSFVGFFSGSIYDSAVFAEGLISYRVGSLASLGALLAVLYHIEINHRGRLQLVWRGRGLILAGGLSALGVSSYISLNGPEYGHYFTTQAVKEELGAQLSYGRCDVVYSAQLSKAQIIATARDCDAHIRAIEAYFGAPGPERITAFLFANGQQKRRLMGAENVYIAKPWRAEVYLQMQNYPHPVLGHELVHAVSGAFGPGLFKVPGTWGGLIANPGLIEGVAVAASDDEDAELSLQQWAKAMQELELLPPLQRVFALGFLGENSSKAYTVAGAFIDWFHREHGAESLRKWYGGASLEELVGASLAELERRWHQDLAQLELPPGILELARARFDRPALFGRRCPHAVDRLFGLARALVSVDPEASQQRCREVLELDPGHYGARVTIAQAYWAAGELTLAREAYTALSGDQTLHQLQRMSAEESLADLELSEGNEETAEAHYRQIIERSVGDDRLRSLELKAAKAPAYQRRALVSLLVGDPRLGRDQLDIADQLGRWAEREPENGVPEYLLGRNLYGNGRYDLAEPRLRAAVKKGLSSERLRAEAYRTLLFTTCARGDLPGAREAHQAYVEVPGISEARRLATERFARRCGALEN